MIVCVTLFLVLHGHPQSMFQNGKRNLRVAGVNSWWDLCSEDHKLA